MLTLAVDTTGEGLSLALGDGKKVWSRRSRGRLREEALLPETRRLLKSAGKDLSDLGRVVAAAGPGRFTGIRVGMTFASALSAALGVPAGAVSLFAALAWRRKGDPRKLAVIVPGHAPSELYMQVFRAGRPAGEPRWLQLPRDAGRLAPFKDAVLTGPASAEDLLGPKPGPLVPLYLKPAYYQSGK